MTPASEKLTRFLDIATTAATTAGAYLESEFQTRQTTTATDKRAFGDIVTKQDREAEKIIIDLIKKDEPLATFIAEESASQANDLSTWIVDPLDGTTNFHRRIPHFAVSIGYRELGHVMVGAVYQPITHELFSAIRGEGANLNGKSITASTETRLSRLVIGTGTPYPTLLSASDYETELMSVLRIAGGIRRLGAATLDLAYVADGRLDFYWERHVKLWDVGAGGLIVEEANGKFQAWPMTASDWRVAAGSKTGFDIGMKTIGWPKQ